MNETKTAIVAKINNVEIIVLQNGNDMVPVKPICEALGIDFSSQLQKLKSDPILASTMVLNTTVGGDEKNREMVTIPFMYVFGWLFRIDSRNVREEARESVLKYQLQCYDALFDHFVGAKKFLEVKEKETDRLITELKQANKNYFSAKTVKRNAETNLEKLSKITYQEYLANNCQLKLDFEEVNKTE